MRLTRPVLVHLGSGEVERYEYGTYPMSKRDGVRGNERWEVAYVITSRGALVLGTAEVLAELETPLGLVGDTCQSFLVTVTYAPGIWVKVTGGHLKREE